MSGVPAGIPFGNAALNAAFTAVIAVPGINGTKVPFTVAQNAELTVGHPDAATSCSALPPPKTKSPNPPETGMGFAGVTGVTGAADFTLTAYTVKCVTSALTVTEPSALAFTTAGTTTHSVPDQ